MRRRGVGLAPLQELAVAADDLHYTAPFARSHHRHISCPVKSESGVTLSRQPSTSGEWHLSTLIHTTNRESEDHAALG